MDSTDDDEIPEEWKGIGSGREEMTTEEIMEVFDTHPAFVQEIDLSKPLHPLLEAMQSLKFDPNNPEECATNYKEEGNLFFEKKQYKEAIQSYTGGIMAKCTLKKLNAILYSNRAAANFHLGNYRTAFFDSVAARKFKPDHMKAIIRGAQCAIKIKRADDGISICDEGLKLEPTRKDLLELRSKADILKKTLDRDQRKEKAKTRKKIEEISKILSVIKERNIELEDEKKKSVEDLFESLRVENGHDRVHINENGSLVWPVMFLYPQFSEMDFIACFDEDSRFADHLNAMFAPDVPSPHWDNNRLFKPENLEIYIEEKSGSKVYTVDNNRTLKENFSKKKMKILVKRGTIAFIVLLKGSKHRTEFLSKYEIL